ncbi:MAG: HAMP domain-containing histidine kinase [Verrucomicrobia bacterium]|nr:HAMP domain-containing histidine kinase [Verrucomicrobiota bacterium]
MNRPWKIWLAFALCALVALVAMGWVSFTTLRLDDAQWRAEQQAELEERVRLALWRMDSLLAPLITEESARPSTAYEAFHATDRAFTKGYTQVKQGDVLVPSPLLDSVSSNILLHFQLASDGRLSSPQVPAGNERELAEKNYTPRGRIEEATARLERLQQVLDAKAWTEQSESLAASSPTFRWPEFRQKTKSRGSRVNTRLNLLPSVAVEQQFYNRDLLLSQAAEPPTNVQMTINAPPPAQVPGQRQSEQGQILRNTAEFQARANVYQQAQQQAAFNNVAQFANDQRPQPAPASGGVLKPVWLGQELVLARRVSLGKDYVIQGCWLDWPHLRGSLLASMRDLLPDADLQPMPQPNGDRGARMLAALPVKLTTEAAPPLVALRWSPVRLSLAVAWVCMLLAAVAVAVLLHGTVSLSERRASFVSAVTHELRTPLTTFKMYSEMLADGMVPEETKRKHYLSTLCSEADRLGHLVENVLAYARLERGSARRRVERIALGDLIARIKPRLDQRAEQAGMTVVADADMQAKSAAVQVDVSAVEQILFNLVDNACKYAAPSAAEKVIHLEAQAESGRFARLRVRDHGPGISAVGANRLFQPFSKSAHEAAQTAPGVGLGLALCRRLSRSMGGDLRLAEGATGGACFVLALPISTPNAPPLE